LNLKNTPAYYTIITIVVIIFAIIITAEMQGHPEKPFSQILSYGPVWDGTKWTCVSDKGFIVYGTVRGLADAMVEIHIDGFGTQSLYSLDVGKMQSFTVGSPGGHTMVITRTNTVSGWFTLQTESDAKASCTQS
jgi:hypothetical protein